MSERYQWFLRLWIAVVMSSLVLLLTFSACGATGQDGAISPPHSTTPITATMTITMTMTTTTGTLTTTAAPALAFLRPIAPADLTPEKRQTTVPITTTILPTPIQTPTIEAIPALTHTIAITSEPQPTFPPQKTDPDTRIGYVNHGANFRSGPGVDTPVMGLLCPGDRLILLEETNDWYRVTPQQLMANCAPNHVGPNVEGWISSNLVTLPDQLPDDYPNFPAGMVIAQVQEVVDGQTFQVEIAGLSRRVRLIGVDAPNALERPDAPRECYGAEATQQLQSLLSSTPFVLLETDETQGEQDRFGQLLSYVWLPGGKMVNYEMIAQGYAVNLTFNLPYKYQELFDTMKIAARQQDRGLWSPSTCNGLRVIVATPPTYPISTESAPTNTTGPTPELINELPDNPTESPESPELPSPVPTEEPTLPPPPAPPPPPLTPLPDFDFNDDGLVTCEDFTTCDEAFEALDAGYSHLDDNHDGIPCENVCN